VVRIYAASSLTDLFERLAVLFEATHPGDDAVLSFAGSQVLRLQIAQGAPTDLFVSAHLEHAQALYEAGLADTPEHVAGSALTLIVPRTNPADLHALGDLPRAERIVIGTPQSPIGRYSRALLAQADAAQDSSLKASVMARVVSEESNARLLRAKVALGEADAALVYATDARTAPGVLEVAIPEGQNVRVDYYMARVLTQPPSPAVKRWRTFMGSPEAQAVLVDMGYSAP